MPPRGEILFAVPHAKYGQGPTGWCTSEGTRAGMLAARQDWEFAIELLRADPAISIISRRTLKAAVKRVKRVRAEAVQIFFEKSGDQPGFYTHLNQGRGF